MALYNTSQVAFYNIRHSSILARYWPAMGPITRRFYVIFSRSKNRVIVQRRKVLKNWKKKMKNSENCKNLWKIAKKSNSTRGKCAPMTCYTTHQSKNNEKRSGTDKIRDHFILFLILSLHGAILQYLTNLQRKNNFQGRSKTQMGYVFLDSRHCHRHRRFKRKKERKRCIAFVVSDENEGVPGG